MKKITTLRITGGDLRGREVMSPESDATHPMGSRERLALMNSIGPIIKDAIVLDAFAGTGAVGLEALSRGAAKVTFVEKNHKTAEILRKNIDVLGIKEKTKILEKDVAKIELKKEYDIVIADPQYQYFNHIDYNTLEKLAKLAKTRFYLSHPATFDPHVLNLELISTKSYAGARISCYNIF